MKTFNKTNIHRTAYLSISDKDNAEIFQTPNHAIHWLKATGLVDCLAPVFDEGLFVNAFKSPEYENKETGCREYTIYSIFNFGAKAAIYVSEFENAECISQKFMTTKEADKAHPTW